MEQPKQILQPRNPGESLKVAEVVLRRRNRGLKGAAARLQERIQKDPQRRRHHLRRDVITPEKLVRDSRLRISDTKRITKYRRNREGTVRVKQAESRRVLFVVRNARLPVSKSSLKALGIARRNTAAFVPNVESQIWKLRSVQPFVYYGYLSDELLHNLLKKKLRFKQKTTSQSNEGTATADKTASNERTLPVSDNLIVEERLGHLGLLCIEDLLAEVKQCGPNFKEMVKHFAPFQLGSVLKAEGIDAKTLESGHIGFRMADKIAKLL